MFTVEEIEDGIFQSIFPELLAEYSQLHSSEEEAWAYIEAVKRETNSN